MRYFLLREAPFGSDFSYSEDKIAQRHNSDLGNDLGNLLQRTLSMLARYRNGVVPQCTRKRSAARGGASRRLPVAVRERILDLRFREALEAVWELVTALNRTIDERKPWMLHKEAAQRRTRRAALRPVRRSALGRNAAASGHARTHERDVAATERAGQHRGRLDASPCIAGATSSPAGKRRWASRSFHAWSCRKSRDRHALPRARPRLRRRSRRGRAPSARGARTRHGDDRRRFRGQP